MQKKLKQTVSLLVIICFWVLLATSCKKKVEDPANSSLPVVNTIKATAVLLNTAQCGGTITTDNGYLISRKGICYSTKSDPTINDSTTNEGDASDEFTSNLTRLKPQTKYYYKAYAINEKGISYGSTNSFITVDSTVKDVEENIYKVVQIGTQIWMAENLKTKKYRNGESIGTTTNNIAGETTPKYQWAYAGNESNVAIYGRLYTWYAAVDNRNLCPTGWHVPTNDEWNDLIVYAGGISFAADKLKEAGNVHWHYFTNINPTNELGFSALPGGWRGNEASVTVNDYSDLGEDGMWWTSTSTNDTYAYDINIDYNEHDLYNHDMLKPAGLSVRCIRD